VLTIALNLSGYWDIIAWLPSLNCANHAPEIFSVNIMEFVDGNTRSFVPATTSVSWYMSFNWLHVPSKRKLHQIVFQVYQQEGILKMQIFSYS